MATDNKQTTKTKTAKSKPAGKAKTTSKSKPAAKQTPAKTSGGTQDIFAELRRFKQVLGVLSVVITVAVLAGIVWLVISQLRLTDSQRVAMAFENLAREDRYQVDFTIIGTSGEDQAVLTGQALADQDRTFTTHSAVIGELNFSFDVQRDDSQDQPQVLTRYNDRNIFITQLGLTEQQVEDADFSGLVDQWVSTEGQTPFIDVASAIASVNLADEAWEDEAVEATETDQTKLFGDRQATAYEVSIDSQQVAANLEDMSDEQRQELLELYGIVDVELTDEQFQQLTQQVVANYEQINSSGLTVWLDGRRMVAITSEDVVVQNSQFDKVELVFASFGRSVNVEPVEESEIISQQEFIERLGALQPEPVEDEPASD